MDQERRASFRCAVQTDEEAAILRTDRADHMVRLVEKSAGGYGIILEKHLDVEVGQIFSLATSGGCCEAKVVHVQHDDEETRIGLQNIRDLKYLPGGSNWLTRRLASVFSSKYARLHLAMIALLCLGFFIWGSSWSSNPLHKGRKTPAATETEGSGKPTTNPAQKNDRELTLAHLNVDGLTKGKVVAELELSAQQQSQIRGILDETAAALALVYEDRPNAGSRAEPADVALQLIFFASRQIEGLLTDEQRARWNKLVDAGAKTHTEGSATRARQPAHTIANQ